MRKGSLFKVKFVYFITKKHQEWSYWYLRNGTTESENFHVIGKRALEFKEIFLVAR